MRCRSVVRWKNSGELDMGLCSISPFFHIFFHSFFFISFFFIFFVHKKGVGRYHFMQLAGLFLLCCVELRDYNHEI